MKLGFIGTGNMASAIICGLLAQKVFPCNKLFAYDTDTQKLHSFVQETSIQGCSSIQDLIRQSDAIILAVKPNIIEGLLSGLAGELNQKLLISIAAGISLERLENLTDPKQAIIRVMPNINLTVGEGMSALCGNMPVTRDQRDFVLRIFRSCGQAIELEEKYFSVFTAIAGSSPAFAYLFIDSLARAAVKHGLPKDLATDIAAQAVLGSARMVSKSSDNPWGLIDKVCSPGGTTIAGLLAMEEQNFIATIVKGIDATIAREKEL